MPSVQLVSAHPHASRSVGLVRTDDGMDMSDINQSGATTGSARETATTHSAAPAAEATREHHGLGPLGAVGIAIAAIGGLAALASIPVHGLAGSVQASRVLLGAGLGSVLLGLGLGAVDRTRVDKLNRAVPTTITGVSGPIPNVASPAYPPKVNLKTVATGLGSLVQVTHAPGDDTGLWLVDQTGTVSRRDAQGKVTTKLDISNVVKSGGEQGLLSVAFHPDFATNGKLYVDYTDTNGGTHIATAHAGNDGVVEADSLTDLMVIDQPYPNHNGGQLQFGPDGFLYIGMGDGGSGDDPQNRAQNLSEHLGKILRIDVDHPSGGKNYGIPADNPFKDTTGAKPEIYATGVRNPWRFSFDSKNGDLYIGDVGQNQFEEVDYAKKGEARGANFGWDTFEGAHAHEGTALATGRVTYPVLEYTHSEGASITGGYVYRGSQIPALNGYYVYGDIASDKLRALKMSGGKVVDRREMDGGRSYTVSYGEGPDGELYGVTLGGELTKVVKADATGGSVPVGEPAGSVSTGTVAVGVDGESMKFDKNEYHVKAGKVTLQLKNTAQHMAHNIGVHTGSSSPMSEMALPGETVDVTVDLEPGEYQIFCAPHEYSGMTAKLVVE